MNFPKECLTDVHILPRCLHTRFHKSDVMLTFIVENYSRLEKNKIYYQCTSSHNRRWTLKIVIAKGTLFVFLSTTPLLKKVFFCILSEEEEERFLRADEVLLNHCLFVSTFCNKEILDPEKKYLCHDKLIIQCKYEANVPDVAVFNTPFNEIPCENEIDELSERMQNLYETGLYSDFSIKVDDTTFLVHKDLLASRSKYFRNLFAINNTMASKTLVASPSAMNDVLIYIYTSKLRSMTKYEMLEVLKIANMLQIDILETKCLNAYFTPSRQLPRRSL